VAPDVSSGTLAEPSAKPSTAPAKGRSTRPTPRGAVLGLLDGPALALAHGAYGCSGRRGCLEGDLGRKRLGAERDGHDHAQVLDALERSQLRAGELNVTFALAVEDAVNDFAASFMKRVVEPILSFLVLLTLILPLRSGVARKVYFTRPVFELRRLLGDVAKDATAMLPVEGYTLCGVNTCFCPAQMLQPR